MLKSVGLVARYDKKPALKLAADLANYLESKGLKVLLEDSLAGKVNAKGETVPLSQMNVDFVITIGGDGTIFRTCITLPNPQPPILAVNMGVRGFLTEIEPKEAHSALEKCLNGQYRVEKCDKLTAKIGSETLPDALNDVVITPSEPLKVLYTKIFKDEKHLLNSQADGLIVATQIGSTGYSLSAGGPVLDRGTNAFVLTPICSLTVFHSFVFPIDSKISCSIIRPKKIRVSIDGNHHRIIEVKDGSVIEISRAKNSSSFIRFEDDFYPRLQSRLLFKGM